MNDLTYPLATVANVREFFSEAWTSVQEDPYDFTTDLEWIAGFARLAAYVKAFEDREPAFVVTLDETQIGADEWNDFLTAEVL